jgi:hypothetical protein
MREVLHYFPFQFGDTRYVLSVARLLEGRQKPRNPICFWAAAGALASMAA